MNKVKNNVGNNGLTIIPIDSKYFVDKPNINLFIDIVYQNFIDLSKYDKLKHTYDDIFELIKSSRFKGFFIKDKKKIIGYLLGEVTMLSGSRNVFFISYVYISKHYRKHGLASKLLDLVISTAKKLKLDTVMLICDTEDDEVYNFYLKRGFMLDLIMRRYDRHDVLSLPNGFI